MTITRKFVLKTGNGDVVRWPVRELLLIGSGFNADLGFDFILNVLGFLYVIRNGVEWRQWNEEKIFCRTNPKYLCRLGS